MKKNNYISLFVALVALILSLQLYSQNDSLKKPNVVKLENFNTLQVKGNMNLEIVQGAENSITIRAAKHNNSEDNDYSYSIHNGKLVLSGSTPENSRMLLTCKNLTGISCSDVADISTGPIVADEFTIKVSGFAKIKMNLTARKLYTDISGSAQIILSGKANEHDLKVSGASLLNAAEFINSKAVLKISGASSATVYVTDTIIGNVSGVSNLTNKVQPAYKNIKTSGISNYKTEGTDTTKFRVGKSQVMIINDEEDEHKEHHKKDTAKSENKKKFKTYWAGFSYGINGLMSNGSNKMPKDYEFLNLNYIKSTNININIFEYSLPIVKEHVNLVTGLGYEINNYRFNKNYVLNSDQDKISATKVDTMNFKKNKLSDSWVNVPLLIQFDTRKLHKKSTLHFSAGVTGGIRVNSHTKQVYDYKGKTYKPKSHDDFNQTLFKYDAMVRIGYGKLDLFATYQLSSMFKSNQGPDIRPFTVGVTLASF